MERSYQKVTSHSCFYGDIINKPKKFKSDISKFVKVLKNLIKKCCELAIIVHSLIQVYFAKNIDNLLVQLISPTSN